jgi:hypothetical protein
LVKEQAAASEAAAKARTRRDDIMAVRECMVREPARRADPA